MFAIFPNISILDTLDKSGKKAFISFSMALTVYFMKPILIIIPPLFLAWRYKDHGQSIIFIICQILLSCKDALGEFVELKFIKFIWQKGFMIL